MLYNRISNILHLWIVTHNAIQHTCKHILCCWKQISLINVIAYPSNPLLRTIWIAILRGDGFEIQCVLFLARGSRKDVGKGFRNILTGSSWHEYLDRSTYQYNNVWGSEVNTLLLNLNKMIPCDILQEGNAANSLFVSRCCKHGQENAT